MQYSPYFCCIALKPCGVSAPSASCSVQSNGSKLYSHSAASGVRLEASK